MNSLLVIWVSVLCVFALGYFVIIANHLKAGWTLRYGASHLALVGALVAAVVPQQITMSAFVPTGALIASVVMVVGSVVILRDVSADWIPIGLDAFNTSCSITLFSASVAVIVSQHPPPHEVFPHVAVTAATIFSSLVMFRLVAAMDSTMRDQKILSNIAIALMLTGNIVTTACVMLRWDPGHLNKSLTGLAIAAVVGLALMRWRLHTPIPQVTLQRERPALSWYVVTFIAVLLTLHGAATGLIDIPWFTIASLSLIFAGIVARVIHTIVAYGKLRDESEQRAQHYASLVNNSSDVIIICDTSHTTTTYVSPAAQRILGHTPEDLTGKPLAAVLHHSPSEVHSAFRDATIHDDPVRLEINVGDTYVEVILAGHDNYVLVTLRDVSERMELRASLRRLAFQDDVTGLGNRHWALQHLDKALTGRSTDFAFLMADVDRFKQVNDTGGHPLGDLVLHRLARRLTEAVGEHCQIARIGGDEFVAIVSATIISPTEVAERMVSAVDKPFVADGRTFQLGLSVGIAHPEPGCTADELMRRADIAMYAAKRGKLPVVTYTEGLTADLSDAVKLDATIGNVLREKRFLLYSQPIVNTLSGDVASAESLIRWVDAHGVHTPWGLLDYARRTGQMRCVSEWVLRASARTLRTTPGLRRLSVNLPAQDLLDRSLLDTIDGTLDEYQVSPDRLVVEITEDEMLERAHHHTNIITDLRARGIDVVIDDFGSGYSSFGYLTDLPISGFKVDRSIIRSLTKNPKSRTIVESLVSFADSSDMSVVAEGVETEHEHQALVDIGCPLAQGFFYAKPSAVPSHVGTVDVTCWTDRTASSVDAIFGAYREAQPQ